ncbi:MAG: hypothetical protein U0802_09080 [Candidatus Binatia bacterium]
MKPENPSCVGMIRAAIRCALVSAVLMLAPVDRSLAYYGVQTNVPESSLSGWSLCYSDTYANSGTSLATILAACDGPNLLLACRPVGSPDLSVLAHAPRPDVIFDTGASNTPHDANGVGWYYNDNYSWGFAPQGEPISRSSCDTYNVGSDDRLCWRSEEGMKKILLKGGAANKSKVILQGKGAGLSDPVLPLAMGTTGILVQLKNESSGLCWQSTFPIGGVEQNASGLKASAP